MPVLEKTNAAAVDRELRKMPRWLLPAIAVPPGLAVALLYILRRCSGVPDFVSAVFSAPVRSALGHISSLFPFSVMELLYVLCGLLLITYPVFTVFRIVKSKKRLRTLAKHLFAFLLVVLYIWACYGWLWGIDYYSRSFTESTGIDTDDVTVEDLISVTKLFADRAAALSVQVPRDKNGSFAGSVDAYFDSCMEVYTHAAERFPCLPRVSCVPKPMVFSKVMSYMGFTGVYFAFTGESNINVDAPACLIPATMEHELAHQSGVTSEQEANFIGILACVLSEDTAFQYAGYLSGLIHLSNALYRIDRDAWGEIRAGYTDEMLRDLAENSAYWQSFQSPVETVTEAVYDTYLKSNGERLGISSYGACVVLLASYFSEM